MSILHPTGDRTVTLSEACEITELSPATMRTTLLALGEGAEFATGDVVLTVAELAKVVCEFANKDQEQCQQLLVSVIIRGLSDYVGENTVVKPSNPEY